MAKNPSFATGNVLRTRAASEKDVPGWLTFVYAYQQAGALLWWPVTSTPLPIAEVPLSLRAIFGHLSTHLVGQSR